MVVRFLGQTTKALLWCSESSTPVCLGLPRSSVGKESACSAGAWVRFLGWEDPMEKEMATHSSILAWRIPWTEEPGGLQVHGVKELDTTSRLNHHRKPAIRQYAHRVIGLPKLSQGHNSLGKWNQNFNLARRKMVNAQVHVELLQMPGTILGVLAELNAHMDPIS